MRLSKTCQERYLVRIRPEDSNSMLLKKKISNNADALQLFIFHSMCLLLLFLIIRHYSFMVKHAETHHYTIKIEKKNNFFIIFTSNGVNDAIQHLNGQTLYS